MNDKKQIEEMRKDLIEIFDEEYEKRRLITPDFTAEKMTAKGYRKQKVGRWVYHEDRNAYEARYFCSECLADGPYQGDDPFCWNCGAQMKGGAE